MSPTLARGAIADNVPPADDMAQRLSTDAESGGPHPIEISILGDLEVRCSGASVELPGPRVRRILVSLVLGLGRPVPTDVIIDRLWGASPPASARKSVQKAVWELRQALGSEVDGFVSTGDRGYVLRIEADAVDAYRVESLVADALAAPPREAIGLLESAERLWRGPALEGFAHLEEARPTAVRLEELRLVASERRLGLLLESGRHAEVLPELEQLASEHPLREELWAHLMTGRAVSGRRNDALAAYQQVRHRLAEELGIEPSSRLRDLEHKILEGDMAADVSSADHEFSSRSGRGTDTDRRSQSATRLPRLLTSFVGRTELLDEIDQRLVDAHLLTLTGVGGSGKTRLAVEAALRLVDRGDIEARFIDLSTVEVADLVSSAVAAALGVGDRSGVDLSLLVLETVGGTDTLIIFDNCEHVLEVTAPMIADLLRDCPDLTVLATSREPLGIPGEHVLPVPPLRQPDPDSPVHDALGSESVELFVARARAADPSFEVDDDNVAAVIEICSRLDGVPLALELAAAKLPAMTATDMADRLDDRFRILGSSPGRPARQATLRATIDWSYGLLDAAEQRAFERVSAFPATFDIAAAGSVIGGAETDVVALMGRLVQRSMVLRPDRASKRTRYRLLDTLRGYGREMLAEHEDDRQCRLDHARYFADLAERFADPRPSDGDDWHETIETEYPNLLAALEFTVDPQPDLAVRLVDALACFWTRTPDRVVDGLRYVEPLLDRTDLDPDQLACVLCCAAELRAESGESQIARREAERALARFESVGNIAGATRARLALGRALVNGGDPDAGAELIEVTKERFAASGSIRWAVSTMTLGFVRRTQGDYDRAARAFAQMLAWARRHDLAYTAAKAEWLLGSVAHHRGSLADARQHCERALAGFEELGDRPGIAHVRMTLGDVTRLIGEHEEARELYTTAHETLSEIGDLRCIASAVKNLGDLERERNPTRSAELYLECLERRLALGDRSGLAEAFEGLASILVAVGYPSDAVTLLGQADVLRAETKAVVLQAHEDEMAATRRTIAETLPTDEAAASARVGADLPLEEALTRARSAVETVVLECR